MPRPGKGDSEQDFVSRFMGDEAMRKEYPDEKQRAAVAYSVWRERSNSGDEYPTTYRCNFIEPGLVHYQDMDMTLLVRKPAIDKMRASFGNRPVINEAHREVTGKAFDFKAVNPMEQADGIVVQAWNDPGDGWDHCSFIVWDERTKRNIANGYSVSCAYRPTQIDPTPGIHHNIPYDGELLDGEYTHLAVVRNPRYEGARIIVNSEGGVMNKLFKWFGGKDKKTEIKSADGLVAEVKGAKVPLKDLIEAHNSLEAKKAAPTPPADEIVNADETVEIDGKPVKVSELVHSYEAMKNAEAEEKAAKEKKDKEDEERRNAEEKAEKEKKDLEEKERQNALNDEEKKRFDELKNAAARRGEAVAPKVFSREEQLAEGARLYGSEPAKK